MMPGEIGHLHDAFRVDATAGTADVVPTVEQFVITDRGPAAPPPVTPTRQVGELRVVAALVNPTGTDAGHETVTILNVTRIDLSPDGLRITDRTGHQVQALAGTLARGRTHRVPLEHVRLGNRGDAVLLINANDTVLNRVEYTRTDVAREGFTTLF